jgi:uncharacterized protein YjbI with pentapeptide repeats
MNDRAKAGGIMKKITLAALIALVTMAATACPTQAPSGPPPDCDAPPAPGVIWSRCDKSGLDLTGVDLTGARLNQTNFTGSNLSGATLTGANLQNSILIDANLESTDLTRAIANGAAKWNGVDLRNANLTDFAMPGANATGADLRGAQFERTSLTQTKLHGANLEGIDMSGLQVKGTDFTGANLHNANLSGLQALGYVPPPVFCFLPCLPLPATPTRFDLADLVGANFSGALLELSSLSQADATGANFNNAVIIGGLREADLTAATFVDAVISQGAWTSIFDRADLTRTNLTGSVFIDSTFIDTIWQDTTCPDGITIATGAACEDLNPYD